MKLVLIVNPKSSSYSERSRKLLTQAFQDYDLRVLTTDERGHATELAREAAKDSADIVAVLGGDGTLNEAANGLVGTETALVPLPGGSTNVFARTIGFSNDAIDAAAELKAAIAQGNKRTVGLGKANDRYFLFHVGIGFDARVIEQVEQKAAIKRFAGHQFFAWKTLLTWTNYANKKQPRFTVRYLDRKHARPVNGYFTICMNTDPYTFLGDRPLNIAPGFGFDNSLAMMTVKSVTGPSFPLMIGSALIGGSYLRRHPRTAFRSGVRDAEITGPEPFPYQLDGDYLGDVTSVHLRYEPDVLTLYLGPHQLRRRRRISRA